MLAATARGARVAFISLCALALGPALRAQIEIADDLLVDLDAADASAGTDRWVNLAPDTIGDFIVPILLNDVAQTVGMPIVETIEGVAAVTFNSTENQDLYQCEFDAPEGLVGLDPTRSIEAWVYNPTIADEETILAWGWRGGPDGTNMSFNYGTNQFFGAIGHWGGAGPDIGWNDAGGAPARGRWHHLVYTYDGSTTRVYADGCVVDETNCETNTEALAPGVVNTNTPAKITLAAQLNDAAGTPNFGLRGTLSIAKVRIHDGVLTPAQIQNNFDEECPTYCPPPGLCECENCPVADQHFRGKATYTRQLTFDAVPAPTGLAVTQPAGATLSQTGLLSYTVPTPAPASFNVRVECSNSEGTGVFTWTVTLVDPPPVGSIEVAEELLVDLRPDHASAGSGTWLNAGTLADFGEIGNPVPVLLGPESSPAVSFNEGLEGPSDDAYQCFEDAPPGVTGLDPTRSVEVWAYNPTVDVEETLVAWGWRGGPAGTNISFNYGTNAIYGAVGHWDVPDIGWDPAGGFPAADTWHHLVYTYDGTTTRVYQDGLQTNFEVLAPGVINTYIGSPITLGVQIISAVGGLDFGIREGVLSLGHVRVHDGVLTPTQIFQNFLTERDIYGAPEPPGQAPVILNAPAEEVICPGQATYSILIAATGVPPPALAVVQPAGATISEAGLLTYTVPDPPPPSFVVEVTATNPLDTASAVWTVSLASFSGVIDVAEDLIVDLDAQDPSAGGDLWTSQGSLGEFQLVGAPRLALKQGIRCVSFNENGRLGDAYQSIDDAPAGIVGLDPTRTIEAWVWNEAIPVEETILAWGHRGGPAGENMSFNYGTSPAFGAVGHWDAPDIGWGMVPEAGTWHHLAYTFDGTTTRVYVDGAQTNSEVIGAGILNTFSPTKIVLARQIEADGVTLTPALQGSLSIARVRIHDGVLTPCQILNNYQVESPEFTAPPCPTSGPDFADTHCTGIEVMETGLPIGNTHIVTASAVDDSGDGIVYTYTATDGVNTIVVGPTTNSQGGFTLAEGSWTFSVTVDDRVECDDQAADATCSTGGTGGDGFRRGDADDSGQVNLTDAIRILNVLFLGIGSIVCQDAADADDSGQVNLTDAIRILNVLFLGIGSIGPPGVDDCGPDPTDDALEACNYGAAC